MAAAGTYQAQLISQAIVDDSNWEPDGVTLQVRFCEGGELYRVTGRLAATLHCCTVQNFGGRSQSALRRDGSKTCFFAHDIELIP